MGLSEPVERGIAEATLRLRDLIDPLLREPVAPPPVLVILKYPTRHSRCCPIDHVS